MIKNKKISLIIPCKNEEAALYSMLQKVPSYIDEVIVIDNNSTDNTSILAKRYGAKTILEQRQVNGVGYGFAHQAGMQKATGDYIVAMDGDDTYPIEVIKETIAYMEKCNADFVSCSRLPLVDTNAISFIRRLGIYILNIEVALLYGYHIKDVLTGMWVMQKHCVTHLSLTEGGWNFSPEIKLAAIAHPTIYFSEFHIQHATRVNGTSKLNIWKTGFDHLFYIVKRRFTVDKKPIRQQLQFLLLTLQSVLRTIPLLRPSQA